MCLIISEDQRNSVFNLSDRRTRCHTGRPAVNYSRIANKWHRYFVTSSRKSLGLPGKVPSCGILHIMDANRHVLLFKHGKVNRVLVIEVVKKAFGSRVKQ